MKKLVFLVWAVVVAEALHPVSYSHGQYPITEDEDYNEGDLNDGRWRCSWHLSGGSCRDGEFMCTCPGDETEAHFKVGCCYSFPKCGNICNRDKDCSRYYNCATCRSGIGEFDMGACDQCLAGFEPGPIGDCKTDINECELNNGGCSQGCVNTYGSYYCTCDDGHRLEEDSHGCERLSCEYPGDIEGGTVTATEDWLHASYATYECDARLTLTGNVVRRCDGREAEVFWGGEQPACRDFCDAVPLEQRRACGSPDNEEARCNQLGCCYEERIGAPSCYHSADPVYIRYGGEKPREGDGSGFHTQTDSSLEGCVFECSYMNFGACKSFGIRNNGYDEDLGADRLDCHLLEKRRKDYVEGDEIVADSSYDIYDPLSFDSLAMTQDYRNDYLAKVYEGCYADNVMERDLAQHVWSRATENTVSACVSACRDQGYKFAGVQNGADCYCGNGLVRLHDASSECDVPCPGDPTQICGGELANSVYRVVTDRRYLGCYDDDADNLDLPVKLWDASDEKSAHECIDECRQRSYKFAGVQNGGQCYCGDTYGKHGAAQEEKCNLIKCAAWSDENCGGRQENAVYLTEVAFDMTSYIDPESSKIYEDEGTLSGIPTRLFTLYQNLRSIVSKKLVVHASENPLTPVDDQACADDCYTPCGNIYHPEGLTNAGKDVVLRFFHINLKDLHKYIGNSPDRVYVYAQTVVIDEDVNVDYALFVRARQMLIDRDQALLIGTTSDVKDLDFDFEFAKSYGPAADMFFQKQSVMCARMLFETKDEKNMNTAWSIINDIIHDPAENAEQEAYIASVRMYQAEMTGLIRTDLHFVPFYTKTHISQLLANYYDRITIYKQDFDEIRNEATTDSKFLQLVEGMLHIFIEADVSETEMAFEAAVQAIRRSNETYRRMQVEYDWARSRLDQAGEAFERGIQAEITGQLAQGMITFVKAIINMARGFIDFDYIDAATTIEKVIEELEKLAETMKNLAANMEQIERFVEVADEISRRLDVNDMHYDYTKFMGDISLTAALQVNLVRWENLRIQADIILTNPSVISISGADGYHRHILDMVNWGLAVTKSMVERAEMTRNAIEQKYLLDSKLEQQARLQDLLDSVKENIGLREAMMVAMAQQTYDVRIDLNEALMDFCQAYFYENLYECRNSYKPSFGGSLSELLLKVNAARRDDLLIGGAPSTVSKFITITDLDTDPACEDSNVCPINYFRKYRILRFPLGPDHPDLIDLHKYRVSELVLDVEGAVRTGSETYLKLRIESSGDFQSRAYGDIYNFITRPLSLAYEYDLDSGHVSIRADVYQPFRNIVHHITPFTSWVIRVSDDRSSTIDVSQVTAIKMRLDGSAHTKKVTKPKAIDA